MTKFCKAGVSYELFNLGFLMGKGSVLGLLMKHELNAKEALDALGEDKRRVSKFIHYIAELEANN